MQQTTKNYGIVRRSERKEDSFFAGFDSTGLPLFGGESNAVVYDNRLHAEAQAILLQSKSPLVQRRAVVLNG